MSCDNTDFWQKLDAVCVINLDHRTDRWEKIHAYLATNALPDKIHRVSAVYGKKLSGYRKHTLFKNTSEQEALFWAGRAGCALSHRRCMELLRKNAWKNMLILEDDAKLLDTLKGDIGALLVRVVEQRQDWQLFYLGATPYYHQAAAIDRTESPRGEVRVGRIMGPLCTHCYVVDQHAAQEIIDRLPAEENVWDWLAVHVSLDSWYANEYGKEKRHVIMGCYPNICVQDDSYSDIEHHVIGHQQGALGDAPHPVEWVTEKEFSRIFLSPKFVGKKWLKLAAHRALSLFYHLVGYRMFHVSIESAGYFGALKAAISELRARKH